MSKSKILKASYIFTGLFLIILSCNSLHNGYNLEFKVTEIRENSYVSLGYYFEGSKVIIDSTLVGTQGEFSFTGKATLLPGMYFIAYKKQSVFDLLIDKDQHFKMDTDFKNPIDNMQVSSDIGNEDFYTYLKKNRNVIRQVQALINMRRDADLDYEKKDSLKLEIEKINSEFKNYLNKRDEFLLPQSSFLKYVNAEKPVVEVYQDDSTEDKQEMLSYLKQHFWDYFELSDPLLLRLPNDLYRKRIKTYLRLFRNAKTDALLSSVELIISKAKNNPETYRYVIRLLCDEYIYKDVRKDAIIIHLYDKYIESEGITYSDHLQINKNLEQRVLQLKQSLVGKVAQNLEMKKIDGEYINLYDIKNEYTVLYFFDFTCEKCVKNMMSLKKYYQETEHDLEVFAVDINNSISDLKQFVSEQKTSWITVSTIDEKTPHHSSLYNVSGIPSIYLLDKSKKIIAKGLQSVNEIDSELNKL